MTGQLAEATIQRGVELLSSCCVFLSPDAEQGMRQPIGPVPDDNSLPAYLFESSNGAMFGVSLDSHGKNLPRREGGWALRAAFSLGVHDPVPAPIDPEPILRGIRSQGYFIWQARRTLPFGTTQ